LQEATSIVTEVTNRGYCDYTAINLNCGCPSPKVAGKGNFGASLMNDPKLVRDIVTAMDKGTDSNTPITVKCRIGTDETLIQNGLKFTSQNYATIDEEEEYKQLCNFIDTVASSGVVTDFQIHARIAVLQRNFSPTDNRKIPTLKYHYIRKLVEEFPELKFSLNGGVDTLPHVKEELDMCPGMNGVMVGRALAANPWSFSMADELLYNQSDNDNKIWKPKNRLEVLQEYGKYADQEEQNWDPVKIRRFIIKAITPLFAGEPNGKRYRIAVDEIAGLPKKRAIQLNNNQKISDSRMDVPVSELIMNAALEHLSEDVLLRTPEESYERLISSSNKSFGGAASVVPRSDIIKDWQNDRKVQEQEEQTV
jgi:tRNA-dihydrouridine synthase A